MIKLSVLYPSGEGITFDMDYYLATHMPLVEKLVSAVKKIEVEQGLAGGEPGSGPIYIAAGHIFFDSMDDFTSSFMPHIATFRADIPNFTNSVPVRQFSEVKK